MKIRMLAKVVPFMVLAFMGNISPIWGADPQPQFLKDINPGYGSSILRGLTDVNGILFFWAEEPTNGRELWKSDGTAAGTVLVKDINPGTGDGGSLEELTNVNGTAFFAATDPTNGRELWKSDGTAAGTVLVKDINTGTGDSSPQYLTNVNGTLFFSAAVPYQYGVWFQLWKSDGTEAGTVLVKAFSSGTADLSPNKLTNVNGTLFFAGADPQALDPVDGYELWKSDGTEAGTVLVKDILPGRSGSNPEFLTNVNGTLFFAANGNGSVWKSDGTEAGTVLVKSISSGGVDNLTNVDGTLFFTARNFSTNTGDLWKSDGTDAGTVLVRAFTSVSGSPGPPDLHFLTNVNGTLFLQVIGENNAELWKSDGTEAGTVLVKNLSPYSVGTSSLDRMTNVNGSLFFKAYDSTNGTELWKTDGTAAGTELVKDIYPGTNGSYPLSLTNVNGKLFFQALDPTNGEELWMLDLTLSSSDIISDLDRGVAAGTITGSGRGNSADRKLAAVRNMLLLIDSLIAAGSTLEACQQLNDTYLKVDGLTAPPDFIQGPGVATIAAKIVALKNSLACP